MLANVSLIFLLVIVLIRFTKELEREHTALILHTFPCMYCSMITASSLNDWTTLIIQIVEWNQQHFPIVKNMSVYIYRRQNSLKTIKHNSKGKNTGLKHPKVEKDILLSTETQWMKVLIMYPCTKIPVTSYMNHLLRCKN